MRVKKGYCTDCGKTILFFDDVKNETFCYYCGLLLPDNSLFNYNIFYNFLKQESRKRLITLKEDYKELTRLERSTKLDKPTIRDINKTKLIILNKISNVIE